MKNKKFSQALLTVVMTTGFAHVAAAKTCDLTIEGNDAMQYDKKELVVEAGCTEVNLTLKHSGKLPKNAMGHNWVLTQESDMNEVVSAGQKAGLSKDYVPAADKKVIAHTKLVGGGESDSVKFSVSKLKKGGSYTYFCTFPGHSALMKGKLIVK